MMWWPITRYSDIYFDTVIVKIENKNNINRKTLLKNAIKKLSMLIRQLTSIHCTEQRSEYVENKLKFAFNNKFELILGLNLVSLISPKNLVFKQVSFAFCYVVVFFNVTQLTRGPFSFVEKLAGLT